MEMLKEIMLNVSENKMHLVGIVALLVLYKTRRIIKFFIDEILHTKPLSEKLFQELHSKRMLGNIQSGQTNELVSDRRICIIGAGMSGLLAGIKLKKAGIPFVIYERAHDVGGTWLFNKYPGCGCDIMSHFYSYSFELNPNWSRVWVKRDEIFEYYQNIVEKYNLRENIEFNTEVVSAVFYKDQSTWEITTRKIKNGNFAEADNPCNRLRKIEYGESSVSKFNILMGATGQLNNPHIPENIKGLENFKGPQFHSARWDSSVDLTNKNVIFVGSGASAVQIVPELVDKVKTLTLLQRSPGWVVLKLDHTYSSITQWAFKNLPFVMKLHRLFFFVWMDAVYYAIIPSKRQTLLQKFLIFFIVHFYQERVLKSKPELRKTVMSNERFGCKRMLISDDWYTSLAKSNVKVIPEGVSSVTEKGVVTTQSETKIDGDVIVWATGFKADKWLPGIHVEVRNSKDSKDGSIVLSELWDKKPPEAFMGMTVPEFPNLFIIYGPNTNLNHSSVVYQSECQMEHIMRILHEMEDKGYKQIQVNKDIFTSFNETLQSNLQNTAFTSGCNSWYLHNGHVSNNWYGSCWDFWTTVDDIDIKSCYHFDGKQQS